MITFQQFQEGMSSDEIEEKLKYVKLVLSVAKEMGKAETISSLIPFLNDWCPDNDDEALTALAKEIYTLNELFTPDEMKYVLPILKHLATTEEVVVRDAAVESINKIVENMSPSVVCEELIPVIEDLFHDEWFTPRVSSASLISKVYGKIVSLVGVQDVSESLKALRDCYFALCKDDTPMVRRAAAKNIFAVFAVCEEEHVGLFVAQYEEFMTSDDEAIKLTLMNFTKELLVRVKEEVDRTKVLTLFQNSMESRSYKIREMAALEVGGVASVLGGEIFISQLLETYMSLLKDNNAEVRKNAIKQLTELSKVIPQEIFLQKLFPFLPTLATDNSPVITEQITGVVIDLSKLFPDKVATLFDLLLTSPTPQVRLLLLRRLNEVTLNETLVRRVVLDEGLDGPDWRVREEVAKHMAYLLSSTQGSPQQDKLIEIYLHLFVDSVSKVRETCRMSLCNVITSLGADFAFENIITKLEKQYKETTNYLLQFNTLYTYQAVIRTIPQDHRCQEMINTIVTEMNNRVPNLRFISCRIITDLAPLLPENVKNMVATKMNELLKDEDRDVRYYAAKGLKVLGGL
ncbi:hypothetical protein WA171_006908 [Blastocystis sp. BT1]